MQTYQTSKEQLELLNRDIFKLLGVKSDDSNNAIRKAYLRLAKKLHPDKTGTKGDSGFKAIKDAYDILTDPTKRQWYVRERLKVVDQEERREMIRKQEELAKRKREYEAQERAKEEHQRQQAMEQVKRREEMIREQEELAKRKREYDAQERAKEERRRQQATEREATQRERRREEMIRKQEELAKRKRVYKAKERAKEQRRRRQVHVQRSKATWEAEEARNEHASRRAPDDGVWFDERAKEEHRRRQAHAQRNKGTWEAAVARMKQAPHPFHAWFEERQRASGISFAFEDARMEEAVPNHVLKEKSLNYMEAKFEYERSQELRLAAERRATLAWEELQTARAAHNSMAWTELAAARAALEELDTKKKAQEFRQKNQAVATIFWNLNVKNMEKCKSQKLPCDWMGRSKEFPLGWIHLGSR